MNNLQFEFKKLTDKHIDGSFATQEARSRILSLAADQLYSELNFKGLKIENLKQKHINKLVSLWQDKGKSIGTIKNRMSHLRWVMEKAGRPKVIPATNQKLGIENRKYVDNDKAKVKVDNLKKGDPNLIESERVRAIAELQQQFGIRREEAIKFNPSTDIHSDRIFLRSSTTKGGRARKIPIRNEKQLAALRRAEEIADKGSMIPRNMTYKNFLKEYEKQVSKAGFNGLHGLRNKYAQKRFEEITGFKSPARGGLRRKELTPEQKRLDTEARLIISKELGHNRISIVAQYIGS